MILAIFQGKMWGKKKETPHNTLVTDRATTTTTTTTTTKEQGWRGRGIFGKEGRRLGT